MSNQPHDDKDGFMEPLKKLWLPVAGFIGAVTLAYNFYKLWLGDQNVNTYLISEVGLILLMITLAWLANKKITRAKSPAFLILVIIFIAVTSSGWHLSQPRQNLSGKLTVLIAQFDLLAGSNEEAVRRLQMFIYQSMKAEIAEYSGIEIVAASEVVNNAAASLEIGKKNRANIVVWGTVVQFNEVSRVDLNITSLIATSLQDIKETQNNLSQPQASVSEINSFNIRPFEFDSTLVDSSYVDSRIAATLNENLMFITAYSLFKEGHYADAALRFKKVIDYQSFSNSPSFDNRDPYLFLGLSYLKMERYDFAIPSFTLTIEKYPDFPNPFINRGVAFASLARYSEAIQDYNQAIYLDANNADAYNNRGLAFYYTGKYQDAIRDFTKVIGIDANNVVAYKNRGLAYQALGMAGEAGADFEKFTKLSEQLKAETQSSAKQVTTPITLSLTDWLIAKYQAFHSDPLSSVYQMIVSALVAYLLCIAALLVGAWRFGSNIFSRSWLTTVASKPLLIIPGLGKWALFLGYKERLLNQPDVKRVENKYFGLPAIDPDGKNILPDSSGNALHQEIAKSLNGQKPVMIVTKGGGGKTSLLARWSYLALNNALPSQLKGFRPAFITPAYYNGDLIDAIADALRERDGVAVEKNIVQAQLESGNFLILFDGISEIEGDQNKGLQEILRTAQNADYKNCRFIVTSRPGLNIPPETSVFYLQPLTSEVVLSLLPLYDLDKEQEYQVRGQLKLFGAKPIEPLLFSMILEQGKTAQFSINRSQLYEKYFKRLLRVNSDTIWEGWNVVLSEIANWFILETGNRGTGIIHEELVDKLSGKSGGTQIDSLIKRSKSYYGLPIETELELLERLKSSGIMQQSRKWRFAHDTFEEYFAASYIIFYITRHEKTPSLGLWSINETQTKSFVGVIEFIREMADEEILQILLNSGLPSLWKDVLASTEPKEEN